MRIVVTGATGFIGQPLCARLLAEGHNVAALSRSPGRAQSLLGPGVACLPWGRAADRNTDWVRTLADADAIVHLAGEPIAAKSWTPEVKAELVRSRVETTRRLVDAMRSSTSRPAVLVCASGINYYGDAGEQVVTEESPPGRTFLAGLSVAWEDEARTAEDLGVRVVRLRTGIVLDKGGPLDKILRPLPLPISPWRLGLGGPLGTGRQWFPWIHRQDVIGMVVWSLTDPRVSGAVNAVAPGLIRNLEFTRALGRALRRPAPFPAPAFLLRIVVGDFADELLTSQRAVPAVAERFGFTYKYPTIDGALQSILP